MLPANRLEFDESTSRPSQWVELLSHIRTHTYAHMRAHPYKDVICTGMEEKKEEILEVRPVTRLLIASDKEGESVCVRFSDQL